MLINYKTLRTKIITRSMRKSKEVNKKVKDVNKKKQEINKKWKEINKQINEINMKIKRNKGKWKRKIRKAWGNQKQNYMRFYKKVKDANKKN